MYQNTFLTTLEPKKQHRSMKLGEVNKCTQILTFVMLDVFMYYTLPQFLSNSFKIFQLLACIYKQSRKLCRLRSAGFFKEEDISSV